MHGRNSFIIKQTAFGLGDETAFKTSSNNLNLTCQKKLNNLRKTFCLLKTCFTGP